MKNNKMFLLLILLLMVSCATAPEPLKYLSRKKPEGIIKTQEPKNYNLSKTRIGFLYRNPVDITNYLIETEKKTGNKILRNTDVLLEVPFCFFVLCIGNDKVIIKEEINKK
jgi:hypothetical protein